MIDKADEIKDLGDRYGLLPHSHIYVGYVNFGLKYCSRERMDHLLNKDFAFAHCSGLHDEEIKTFGRHPTVIRVVPITRENFPY